MLPEPAVAPVEHHHNLNLDQQVAEGGGGWGTLPYPTPPQPLPQALPPARQLVQCSVSSVILTTLHSVSGSYITHNGRSSVASMQILVLNRLQILLNVIGAKEFSKEWNRLFSLHRFQGLQIPNPERQKPQKVVSAHFKSVLLPIDCEYSRSHP